MQSEEYYKFIEWCKIHCPELLPLTNQNVKFIEYLLKNKLGTKPEIFTAFKKYELQLKYQRIQKFKKLWIKIKSEIVAFFGSFKS